MEGNIANSATRAAGKWLCGLMIVIGLTTPSMAQVPGSAAPTREELQRQQLETDLRDNSNPVSVDGGIERAPCPLAAPQFANLKFFFNKAEFKGLNAVDPGIVGPAWADYVGKEIPVATICDIRDRAATALRARGYLAAVRVPEQKIGEGVVLFDVLLARMRAVQVRGDTGRSAKTLQNYFAKLQNQEVFNTNDAERYLLLARDLPGIDVRLTLQPLSAGEGGQPGDVVGVFDVTSEPVFIDANVQNLGSTAIGRFGGLVRVRANGLTGLGDETMISVYTSHDFDEQIVVSGHHEFRVGGEGLTLGLAGTIAFTEPEIPGGPNVFESETFVASAYARYPLLRSQAQNLTVTGGADFVNQQVDFTGQAFSEDQLRVAFARADFAGSDKESLAGQNGYSSIEPRIAYAATLEVRQGVDVFDASPTCGVGFANCLQPGVIPPSRLDADPTGLVVRGATSVTFRPEPHWGFTGRMRFQYSPDPLLSYEQFSGGNFTVGRGYDPGAIIGDSGVGVQLEAFYGSLVPESQESVAWQPFAFFDLAEVKVNNVPGDNDQITSVGGGIRMAFGRQGVLDLTGAIPLQKTNLQTSRSSARMLLSFTMQLAPWFR